MLLPNDFLDEARDQLSRGVCVKLRAEGDSMMPFIRGGLDIVIISPVVEAKLGRIVLFQYRGRYIIHRIIAIKGDTFIMQGDGNRRGSESAKKDDLYGTVSKIIRGKKEINPYSFQRCLAASLWRRFHFARRYLLMIVRQLT